MVSQLQQWLPGPSACPSNKSFKCYILATLAAHSQRTSSARTKTQSSTEPSRLQPYLLIYLSTYLPIYLSTYLLIYLSTYLLNDGGPDSRTGRCGKPVPAVASGPLGLPQQHMFQVLHPGNACSPLPTDFECQDGGGVPPNRRAFSLVADGF